MADKYFVVTALESKGNNSYIFKSMEKAWSRFYTEVAGMIYKHGTVYTAKEKSSIKLYEWKDGAKLTLSDGYMNEDYFSE